MEQFEKRLFNLKVPKLENDSLKHSLRRDLIARFVNPEAKYRLKFKLAVGFSALMLILFLTILLKPQIATQINRVAFHKKQDSAANEMKIPDNLLRYSSADFPATNSILPENANKTYIIRRYSTGKNGKIMVVSEINKNPRRAKVKIVY